jgi:hypothetical protein
MRESRTSGSMSGDGKRSAGHRPQATAPILDSTKIPVARCNDDSFTLKEGGLPATLLTLSGY